MLSAENLASIESEGRRISAYLRRDPERPVPQYPEWTMADLASHTASIHGRTTQIVTELPVERISAPTIPNGADVADWYDETLEGMLAALTDADPELECWGFGPSPSIGFWERRMVIETGVHRWDAAQAFQEEDRLIDNVARSGLDEFADMWLPHLGEVGTMRVTATDIDESWVYGDGDPVAEIEGTASDLYLRLISRPSPVGLPEDWATAVDGLAPPPKR
ncbi:MAG TPA: maleylpyruvate isomerase family mycothiol-dependent enzyme [Acidimicrobiia bacterium]|nr:maleylpyruvate isomerase family mycothiol-dependent enzyme [Acidimicrobiia bacterium]